MTTRELQEQLEKERAILKAAKDRIAAQNRELEELRALTASANDVGPTSSDNSIYFAGLAANLNGGICIVDENRNIVMLNKHFCDLFGIKDEPEKFVGMNGLEMSKYINASFIDGEVFMLESEEVVKNRKPVLDKELKLVNGQTYNVDYIPFYDGDIYKGHLWKFTNITRQKTIGETFQAQKQFYEHVLNNIPADIAVHDSQQRFLYVNPTAIKDPEVRAWMIGKTHEDYCEYRNKPLLLAEDRNKVFAELMRTKKQQQWEESFTLPDGSARHLLRMLSPVLDGAGDVELVIAYGVDITERKSIEEQVNLSEKRYREIFSYSQAWICTHDMEGRLLTLNASACKILGYEENAIVGRTIQSFIPEKHRAQFTETYLRKIVADGKAEGILNIINKEGKNVFLLYQNYLLEEKGEEPYVIGFAQDISQRLFAEEALKKSEEKYKGIIENINLGMLELDNEDCIIFANQRFCKMSGYEPDELIGKKATDLFLRGVSLKRTREQLSRQQYGVNTNYELAVKTKNGEEKWWLTSATPLYNADETSRGTISIHLDITEQKKLEDQLKEAKLLADRSSQSKDIFLTNMSHEIRTPLNAIMGLGKLLSKSELNGLQKNYLQGIESASTNLLGIVNDLLDFSKIEAGKITLENISFSLETIAEQVVSILTHKAEEKGLLLYQEIDSRIAPVLMGDPFRVNQVFMNMVSNAIKFTDKGTVCLKAFLLEEKEDWQKLLVIIEDTGVGIKEEYLDTIFDKFTQEDETVVRKFGGTGLGMSITKQLMELMGGNISVTSKKNIGTTISLTFSFKKGTAKVFEKKRTVKTDTGNISNKKILLVEDNNLNRLLAYTILTDYGAVIEEAENGLQAVDMMRKNTYDMVLMDIQMPVMDGIQATKIIRSEINKTVPILALTANAIKGKEHQFIEAGMNDFIFKPYNEMNLVNPIAKWLNRSDEVPAPQFEPATAPVQTVVKEEPKPAAVAQEIPSGPLYDLGKLLSMGRNDQTFIKKMLNLFISETPPAVDKMVEAYKAGDYATVKYYAHRMKPSITNLGINTLKDDIVKIEFMEEPHAEIERLVNKLHKTIALVVEQMTKEYDL